MRNAPPPGFEPRITEPKSVVLPITLWGNSRSYVPYTTFHGSTPTPLTVLWGTYPSTAARRYGFSGFTLARSRSGVRIGGFEPPTSALSERRANQLCHTRMFTSKPQLGKWRPVLSLSLFHLQASGRGVFQERMFSSPSTFLRKGRFSPFHSSCRPSDRI